MVTINSVFKYVDIEKEEKIRIIDIIGEFVYIVTLEQSTSMPRKELAESILQEINAEKLVKIPDPFARVVDEKNYQNYK